MVETSGIDDLRALRRLFTVDTEEDAGVAYNAKRIERRFVRTLIAGVVDAVEYHPEASAAFLALAHQIAFLFAEPDGLGIAETYEGMQLDQLRDQLEEIGGFNPDGRGYRKGTNALIEATTRRTMRYLHECYPDSIPAEG